jgi:sugar lactone lactonase YvrE
VADGPWAGQNAAVTTRPRAPRLIHPAKAAATTPPPLTGEWAPHDTRLDGVALFPLPSGIGPEDVLVDGAGRLLAGAADGRIWCWDAAHADPANAAGAGRPRPPRVFADTGGRPLGLELDPRDGSLIVCDAWRGLLRITEDGSITTLATTAAGRPIVFGNNASVARDGTVFFTDSSHRYPITAWKRDLLEYRPNGRVLAWHPESGQTEVVHDGLYFPNGIALTPDENALVVAETSTHRLLRIRLGGRAGGGEPEFLTDLPAYPDNISAVGDGTYWVALASPRLAIAEWLLPHPRIRQVAALLPDRLQPQPRRYGLVALVDGEGRLRQALHGPAGRYHMITGVRQHGDTLWLGSLIEPAVARTRLSVQSTGGRPA